MGFQISALDHSRFSHLFGQSESALAGRGVLRKHVDTSPGFPCRVSLRDAEIGETVLLLNYEHQPMPTPYRSSHAIFVIEHAQQAMPEKNEVPRLFRHRVLSLRAFDVSGSMVNADVCRGDCLQVSIDHMLQNDTVDYLHIHNAGPGCYAALVRRC